MLASRVVPLAVLLAASACTYRTSIVRLEPTRRPPTPVQAVRILGQEPEQRYTVIAFVSVSQGLAWRSSDQRFIRHLARQAAKLGGDAVLLGTESFGQRGDARQLTAKVIVFTREARSN